MSHSTRVRVFNHHGSYTFASKNRCNALESAQKGYWLPSGDFQMFTPCAPRDTAQGEIRVKSTDAQSTLKYGTGPQFPVLQWERA